jgi:hypothetical protein
VHANHSFRKPYPFWCGRNSSITVKSQFLTHSASHRKTTDTFLANMEYTATHSIRKAFITARKRLLLLDGEQTMVSKTALNLIMQQTVKFLTL